MRRFTLEYADLGQAMAGPVTRVDLDLDAIGGHPKGKLQGLWLWPSRSVSNVVKRARLYLLDRGFDRLMRVWNLP